MKSRPTSLHHSTRTRGLCTVIAPMLLALAGSACDAPPQGMTDGFAGASGADAAARDAASSHALVLAEPRDEPRAMSIELAMASLDGRLDATLGAPARSFTYTDATATWVLDQQFTWNGRVSDSYVNTRRTYRRASE